MVLHHLWRPRSAVAPALVVLLAGCGTGRLGPVMPMGATPATLAEVDSFVAGFRPAAYQFHRFRWQFKDDRASAGGRGSVRIAAPDSLRFDVAGPLGSGKAAAFVVGDSAQWAEPEEDVEKLVPDYPLLWAMLGVPRAPSNGATLRRVQAGRVSAWQFIDAADTVEYVLTEGAPRQRVTDVRRGGKRIGRVTTELGPDGAPLKARLVVPSVPAQLDITFYLSRAEAGFAPDTWVPQP